MNFLILCNANTSSKSPIIGNVIIPINSIWNILEQPNLWRTKWAGMEQTWAYYGGALHNLPVFYALFVDISWVWQCLSEYQQWEGVLGLGDANWSIDARSGLRKCDSDYSGTLHWFRYSLMNTNYSECTLEDLNTIRECETWKNSSPSLKLTKTSSDDSLTILTQHGASEKACNKWTRLSKHFPRICEAKFFSTCTLSFWICLYFSTLRQVVGTSSRWEFSECSLHQMNFLYTKEIGKTPYIKWLPYYLN